MYSLRALPFGGFIKAKGLDDLEDCPVEEDFREKSILSRASILAAGSAMNILLGFIIFMIAFIYGEQRLSAKVETVLADYPAQQQGVLVGDEITHINNSRVIDVQTDLIQVIQSSNGDDILLGLVRNNEALSVTVSPQVSEKGTYVIGVSFPRLALRWAYFSPLPPVGIAPYLLLVNHLMV